MKSSSTSITVSQWKATASIDYITIRFPKSKLKTIKDATDLAMRGRGTIQCAKKFGQWGRHGCDWLTVHDPDRDALQVLIESFPETEILELEISMDLRPRDGSKSIAKLTQAFTWLRTSLFPQKHQQMAGVSHMKRYDPADGMVKRIGLELKKGIETVYWQNRSGFEQVRLYVKQDDPHIKPIVPSARIEVTLNRGGCQIVGLTNLKSLPVFATPLRRYISPFFEVAAGIKPKIKRLRSQNPLKLSKAAEDVRKEQAKVERKWNLYGAPWAAKHDYKVIADIQANRLIGGALNELRRDLKKLKLP